ncbi:hypothetical protein IMCC3135_10480 [Granulosicoccus antarcticus IMCC3135]|uniref:Uncharacterized protein n=1 Tax=Granulosicoccus antarcticus IMCC3135 TaxID=1192854 RepID=A0A2Z2NTV6_9GAMM|nr:hypothetical protein IMCC3135_10480 [Granulosicoccus antarcticus IMCC3135]
MPVLSITVLLIQGNALFMKNEPDSWSGSGDASVTDAP